jgi:hypothetical protein
VSLFIMFTLWLFGIESTRVELKHWSFGPGAKSKWMWVCVVGLVWSEFPRCSLSSS